MNSKLRIFKSKPATFTWHKKNFLKHFNLRLIDAETPAVQPRFLEWSGYSNYTTIYSWLDELLETHSDILTSHLVGTTYQGRPIRAVKLSHKAVRLTIYFKLKNI